MEIKEMIEVLKAFEEGKEIEYYDGEEWVLIENRGFTHFNFINNKYRIKPQLTREEITQNWVKDNNIVVGSKVKIVGLSVYGGQYQVGKTVKVTDLYYKAFIDDTKYKTTIGVEDGMLYEVESLEPYKEEIIPFTFNDRNLFRGRYVRWIGEEKEFMVDIITPNGLCYDNQLFTYKELLQRMEFVDGSKFGKLQ